MVKLYKHNHEFIKQNYPIVYNVFNSTPGYDKWKQVALKLKEKYSAKESKP